MSDDRLVPVEDERPPQRARRGIYLLLGLAVSGWMGFLVLAGVLVVTRLSSTSQPEREAPKAEIARQVVTTLQAHPEPAQPAAPPQPVAILTTYEERRRVQERVRQADAADHEDGSVSAARSLYEYAAGRGWAPAALALAFTYDPNELERRGVTVLADRDKARACYIKARELMNAAVAFYLARLPAGVGGKC